MCYIAPHHFSHRQLLLGDLDPIIHRFLGLPDPPLQTPSRLSLPFFQSTRSLPTDKRTDVRTERMNTEFDLHQQAAYSYTILYTATLPNNGDLPLLTVTQSSYEF